MRTLLVEDDATLALGIAEGLARHGFMVESLGAAEPADAVLACTAYDLLILDIGLPRMTGLELLQRVRRRGQALPVPELVARCQALVRRSLSAASSVVTFGPVQLDMGLQQATIEGRPLPLTRREWEVLQQLMLASPNVVSKHKLIDSLGRWDHEVTTNAVEICVSRLRAKLDSPAISVRTVRGIGYRLDLHA
jgi:DNA-binding response OmpR family regulator